MRDEVGRRKEEEDREGIWGEGREWGRDWEWGESGDEVGSGEGVGMR